MPMQLLLPVRLNFLANCQPKKIIEEENQKKKDCRVSFREQRKLKMLLLGKGYISDRPKRRYQRTTISVTLIVLKYITDSFICQ